jgi:hypothetical protein
MDRMMTLGERMQDSGQAIVQRWTDAVLATYPEKTAKAFGKRKDQFANPVGHTLRVSAKRIFEALLADGDASEIRRHLHEIIRIRAVQQFAPSDAVGFVFLLKDAIRAELGEAIDDPQRAPERLQLEQQIDRLALAAFDVFVQCREQVMELRINELKRQIPWAATRVSRNGAETTVDLTCGNSEA